MRHLPTSNDPISTLNLYTDFQYLYTGTAINHHMSIIREPNNRYYESVDDYPEPDWPSYASGALGYALSFDVVRCILKMMDQPDYVQLHVEDGATAVLARKCRVEPDDVGLLQGVLFEVKAPPEEDLPENTLPWVIGMEQAMEQRQDPDMLPYQFNKRASRSLGELRESYPELRDDQCAAQLPSYQKLASEGWDSSVIVTESEEEPTTLVRTVRTILENTPEELLREIIIVDDGSSKHWKEQLYPTRENSDPSMWIRDYPSLFPQGEQGMYAASIIPGCGCVHVFRSPALFLVWRFSPVLSLWPLSASLSLPSPST